MRGPTKDIVPIYLQVPPADIAAIKFLFESYESVAIIRTLDPKVAVIVLLVVPDFLDVAREILASLCRQITVVELTDSELAEDDWLLAALKSEAADRFAP